MWAAFYGVLLILFSVLAAYKCKGLSGRCSRRRNRRRRKTSRTYYYLNKSAAENATENIGSDPFLNNEVQLSNANQKSKSNPKKSRLLKPPNANEISMIANQSSLEDKSFVN